MNPRAMKFVLCALCFGVCLAISLPVRAQVSGATLSGAITDAQGGAVVGAKVSARNLGTSIVSETNTNESGAYTIPNLVPADYEVSVTAAGFSTTTSKVTLTVGAKQEMNFKLTVGQVSQTVEVTGAALQVDLASSTISGDVNGSQVRELPLNGRDWASLATLQPGVTENQEHRNVTVAGGAGGRGLGDQLSISGARPSQNSYRMDGVIVNDYSNQGPGSVLGGNLGVDAIAEFSVLTNSYSAEYGFTAGGVINAITKSGTNTFHGDAFEFVRNSYFDANEFFNNAQNIPKSDSPFRRNQFGGSAGWKIFKDKTFLFGAYEGIRQVLDLPNSTGVTVSDAVRGGSYATCGPTGSGCTVGTVTNIPSPATNGAPYSFQVPINPEIQKFLPIYPAATGTAIQGNPNAWNAPFEGRQTASENFFTLRADQKISDKDSIFATYLRDNSTLLTPQNLGAVDIGINSYRQAAVIEETHIFSPSVVNTVRAGDSRTTNLGGDCPVALVPAAGDPALGMLPGFFAPGITLTGTGITSFSGGLHWCTPEENIYGQMLQFFDDAGKTVGNHSLKFGFEYMPQEENGYFPLGGSAGSGTWSFMGQYGGNPSASTGACTASGCGQIATMAEYGSSASATCLKNPGNWSAGYDPNGNDYNQSCGTLVNFLSNLPLSSTRPNDLAEIGKHYLRDKIFGGYIQDDWRIRPSLTLNLGLRYEMSTIPYETQGKDLTLPSIAGSPGGPGGVNCVPAPATNFTPYETCTGLKSGFWSNNPTLKNFEPRIGFAWDPFHDGKTAVRGGFGMFDSLPLAYELLLDNAQAPPFRSTFAGLGPGTGGLQASPGCSTAGTTFATACPGASGWPGSIVGDAAAHIVNPVARNNWNYIDTDIKRNYVIQMNFNIQRILAPNTTLTVGYAGSRGYHNPMKSEAANTIVGTQAPASVGGFYYWPLDTCAGGPTVNGLATPGPIVLPGCPTGFPNANNASSAQKTAQLINSSIGADVSTLYAAQSWYDSLQVRLDQKLTHGFNGQLSFTYAKAEDNSSGSVAGDNSSLDYATTTWYNNALNKGLSDYNISRNLVANISWTSPTPKNWGAFAGYALGGWQLGGIVTIASGIPSYPNMPDILGEDIVTVNSGSIAPGCSPQNLVNPNYRHNLFYFNTSCFQPGVAATSVNSAYCNSAPGSTFGNGMANLQSFTVQNECTNIRGNLGRNTITGPGTVNFDFSMFKNNYIRKISETTDLQFRAEMFNVFNHTNFQTPGTDGSATLTPFFSTGLPETGQFGKISSALINREIQFALKLIF